MRTDSSSAWWRDWQPAALVLLVLVAYFPRAGELPLRGEESTRAQIAFEMTYWNDWLIPRVQGEAFRIRPPLQNWVNAGCCVMLGSWDVFAIRLPSLLATLATTLLIYSYARLRLGRLGAFTAAAAFATMAEMFKMGTYAETEALFILFVSAALLVWHRGILCDWPDWLTFTAGYTLMALATLTKGIQAPPYFVGAVVLYLVLTRDWRRLFSTGHLAGLLAGALVVLAWLVPYGLVMGWTATKEVWLGDQTVQVSRDVLGWSLGEMLLHLVTYPLEVVAATLPWCLLLLPYLSAELRRRLGSARPQVLFICAALAVAWPTCWIPPQGLPRYFAPLFPCLAVLVGLAVERCAEAEALSPLALAWRRYRVLLGGLMLATALLVAGLSVGAAALPPRLEPLAEPLPLALAYAALSATLAYLVLRRQAVVQHAVVAITAFLVVTFTGVVMDVRVRRSVDAEADVQQIRAQLPPRQQLVSLDGQVDSLFNYLYRVPIVQPRRCAPFGADAVDGVEYFCFSSAGAQRPALPFHWEELGTVNLDRNRHAVPERVIVVGRRLPGGASSMAQTVNRPR